jgi:riboflavin biosynthesis pyrimidine reductase
VRALLPEASVDVDLARAYEVPPPPTKDRPFVRANMISTLDGAVTLNGRSGMLGGPADRRVFAVLRAWADVIVVGAGTMRAENYGPARIGPAERADRRARRQSEVPPIAVVTRSAHFDWTSPFFDEAEARPIIFTTAQAAPRTQELAGERANVVAAGADGVDLRQAFSSLAESGCRSVLLEGGPGLNADVVHAGLLDELCLTLSPRVVAGNGPRVLAGPELALPLELDPVHLLEEDGFLFYRLTVRRQPD